MVLSGILLQKIFFAYPSTRGRLITSLFRIKRGNPKTFIPRAKDHKVDTIFHILLDVSPRMYGKRTELVTASCHAIALACSAIKGINTVFTALNGIYWGDTCSVYPLLKPG